MRQMPFMICWKQRKDAVASRLPSMGSILSIVPEVDDDWALDTYTLV